MSNKFVIADLHFGHANIIKFADKNGRIYRGGYTDETGTFHPFNGDIRYHDEMLIERINAVVKPEDSLYLVGDVGKPLSHVKRLNGKKTLILGNHDDVHSTRELGATFEDVLAWKYYKREKPPFIITHFPLHPDVNYPAPRSICVHGHTHSQQMMRRWEHPSIKSAKVAALDPWYYNVCVEHTNHAPVAWDDLLKGVQSRWEAVEALGETEPVYQV